MSNICSVCKEEYEDKYFDKEQNKCILHCEKDDEKWERSENLNLFWEKIREYIKYKDDPKNISIDSIAKTYTFKDIFFLKSEITNSFDLLSDTKKDKNFFSKENGLMFKRDIIFENCHFQDDIDFSYVQFEKKCIFKKCLFEKELNFYKSEFSSNLEILECSNIYELNLSESEFTVNGKLKIKQSKIIKNANFKNTKFNALVDFYKTTFNEVIFYKTDFNNISVFTETVFNDNVNFQYTTFNKLAIFRKTIFKNELNLIDSIFKERANFLDASSNDKKIEDLKLSNRETARIIKNSFEQKNNIIEANKFYALEMKEREKELDWKKSFTDWIVFKFHGLSSNHSQSWYRPLILILIFSLLSTMFSSSVANIVISDCYKLFFVSSFYLAIGTYLIFIANVEKLDYFYAFLFSFLLLIYYFLTKDIYLDNVSHHLVESFKIVTTNSSNITTGSLIFRVTIAYLIYQFIISIRQNTRRK